MIRLIGSKACPRCDMTKKILDGKNLEYEYLLIEDLDDKTSENYINMAKEKNILSMPIILKNNEVITLQEV